MKISEMIEKKKEYGYTYEMIARMAGVSIATVKKIFSGEVDSPRYSTLQKLEQVFEKPYADINVREIEFKYDADDTNYTYEDYKSFPEYASIEIVNGKIYPKYPSEDNADSEYHSKTFTELANSPKNGSYTYEDYIKFPGDIRVEIVRGYIYAMAAPSFIHQQIQLEMVSQIRSFIRKNKGKCIPGISPTDIKLFEDSLTTVQPDVYIICNKDIITKTKVEGAPDFVVEILSPSTSAYDKTTKFEDYRNAGVREIWFVDYEKKQVICHDLTKSKDQFVTYVRGFRDQIPLAIYDGEFCIDFAEIDDYISSIAD